MPNHKETLRKASHQTIKDTRRRFVYLSKTEWLITTVQPYEYMEFWMVDSDGELLHHPANAKCFRSEAL